MAIVSSPCRPPGEGLVQSWPCQVADEDAASRTISQANRSSREKNRVQVLRKPHVEPSVCRPWSRADRVEAAGATRLPTAVYAWTTRGLSTWCKSTMVLHGALQPSYNFFPDERTGCSAFVGKLLGNFLYAASGMLLEIFFYITETNQLSLMVVKQPSH